MGDVPWARHRRALVLDVCHARQWVECVGVDTDDGEPAWEASGLDECGDVSPDRWLGTLCPTALLPDQCPRCYGTGDTHADGCMVAANLARGVPEFWAPWVMETPPPTRSGAMLCYGLLRNGQAIELQWYSRNGVPPTVWEGWETPNRLDAEEIDDIVGYFALGPNGPTLSPWGEE